MDYPSKLEYKGRKYYLQSTGRYYARAKRHNETEALLHRVIWQENFGDIPDGFHIHHIDGDWTNNEPDNLECISPSEHYDKHRSMYEARNNSIENIEHLKKIREKAIEWSRSETGRKRLQEIGRQNYKNKPIVEKKCVVCGAVFKTKQPEQHKYCSKKCKSRKHEETRKKEVSKCLECKKEFKTRAGGKAKYCSYSCASKSRMREQELHPKHERACVNCGSLYRTNYPNKSKFCCNKCRSQYNNKKKTKQN